MRDHLVVRCPTTSGVIRTGIQTDYRTIAKSWDTTLDLQCPHCGGLHRIAYRDAYIKATLDDVAEGFERVSSLTEGGKISPAR
jgi:hypothetical protein